MGPELQTPQTIYRKGVCSCGDLLGEWMLRGLNKVDEPFLLLAWREDDILTVRKIREDGFVRVDQSEELRRWSRLDKSQRKKERHELTSMVHREMAEKLGIKGSLPYDVRQWITGLVLRQEPRD